MSNSETTSHNHDQYYVPHLARWPIVGSIGMTLAAVGAAVIKTSYTLYDKCPLNAIWLGILVDVILALLLLSSLIL